MAAKKSCNVVCFKDERKKEDPLLMEIQRQCEGTKDDHEVQKTSTRNPEKEYAIICHSIEEVAPVFWAVKTHRQAGGRVFSPLATKQAPLLRVVGKLEPRLAQGFHPHSHVRP
ncbi:hypothetical protein R6Z07F_020244 [Ovis aries]